MKPHSTSKKLRNPRIFSGWLAGGAGLGVVVAMFVGRCFQLGDGNLFTGLTLLSDLTLHNVLGILLIGVIGVFVALFVGRFLGTMVAAVIAGAVLLYMVGVSYVSSQGSARFRAVIWKAAPPSVTVVEHVSHYIPKGGTIYTFVVRIDSATSEKLCKDLGMVRFKPDAQHTPLVRQVFSEASVALGAQYARGGEYEIAFVPEDKIAFIIRAPLAEYSRE